MCVCVCVCSYIDDLSLNTVLTTESLKYLKNKFDKLETSFGLFGHHQSKAVLLNHEILNFENEI